MAFRINPLWWPALAVASPLIVPFLALKNRRFRENRTKAERINRERLERAQPIELPALDFIELTVLAEWHKQEGFLGEPGVSYFFRTDMGSLLFDVGFGADRGTLAHNAGRLGVNIDGIDALAVSHLHIDHMGGMKAGRANRVGWPEGMGAPNGKRCFLPDDAAAGGFTTEVVRGPCMVSGGLATTGPLARSLFFLGLTEEQALLCRLKGKGLAVFTGCGHPTIEVILEMVRRLSDEPLYAFGGGLHFPVTRGRGRYGGIQVQMLAGTGVPPWRRITDDDLTRTIATINEAVPKRVYLSAHDTCDHALARMKAEIGAEVEVLKAGATYRL
jgi:7,8-dihydropterin-6-yl-methyl-4-(beta-D-ribofuranosyl)aminobenzene 5'-phosphate synthase